MKDLKKKLDLFVSKVHDECNRNMPEGGIIDTLIKPIFESEYKPNYDLKTLIGVILNDKSVARSEFGKHFLKTNLRFKISYNGEDITTDEMVQQIPKILNTLDLEICKSVDKIKKHIYVSKENAKKLTKKGTYKSIPQNHLIQLSSGEYFDRNFGGTNATTNVKPILDELIKLDPKLTYKKVPIEGYNQEVIKAYL
tara:strand:- start:272 stop:859 length:588 start_codon:yes stop_codon:yes gene_type:complete